MAADDELSIEKKMTDRGVKKLLPGEKVEVLYSEEGLKGSWHIGVVIDCGRLCRSVELVNLLKEDNSSKLVDSIPVSPAIEGLKRNASRLHRNWIRPVPPICKIKETVIRYGLCVDAFVDDAWWEGVVFDHHEGSSERLIFFPDQGDQQVVSFHKLRLTQEWNEASGLWKHRGEWVFLQVIQYFEREGPLPVSIREIWYDLRSMASFLGMIGLWISGSKSIWYELIAELIQELVSVVNDVPLEVSISSNELCKKNSDQICFHEGSEVQASREQFLILSSGNETHDIHHCTPHLRNCSYSLNCESGIRCTSVVKNHHCCGKMTQKEYLNSSFIYNNLSGWMQQSETRESVSGITTLESSERWKLMDLKAKKCDEAISLYLDGLKDEDFEPKRLKSPDKKLNSLELKAKRHLVALGWIIRIKRYRGRLRYQFVSPMGQCYCSLRTACFGFVEEQREKKGEKICSNLRTLDVFRFVPSSCDLSMSNGSETGYTSHDNALNVLPAEKKNQFEGSNQIIELNISNGDTRTSTILKRKRRSGMKKSDVFANSAMNENTRCEFAEEKHVMADCSSERRGLASEASKEEFPMDEDIEPCDFPGAVTQYIDYCCSRGKADKKQFVGNFKLMKLNSKKHLLFLGWRILKSKHDFFYVSPSGKFFRSLYAACKTCLEEENCEVGTSRSILNEKIRRRLEHLSTEMKPKKLLKVRHCANTIADENFHEGIQVLHNGIIKGCSDSSKTAESAVCSFSKMSSKEYRRSRKRRMNSPACQSLNQKSMRHSTHCSSACAKLQKRKTFQTVKNHHRLTSISSCRVRRSSKRSREVDVFSPSQHVSRSVLSLLIENDIVLPRQKVMYKSNGLVMMEGRITREGIKCKCCSKVHTLSAFEAHAGSTLRRPAANIHLKDGRSLLQCQIQMLSSKIPEGMRRSRLKIDCSIYPSDNICSVCHDGGSLILCDHCPSSFHLDCVGLKDVPEAKWFCPWCRCHICGMSEFNPDTEQFTDKTVLHCDQCEHEYHVGCVRQRGCKGLQSCPTGNWFCSKICSKIFLDLRKLVGISKPTAVEGLSCTILRSERDYRAGCDQLDSEIIAEHHSKLCVALKVLHECFVTIMEPRTQSDLVGDIIFNKESELKRLNFYGFYSMLLEKGDELVSVATFRIYGEKIAEMPLVGTRVQYRRQGMCRLLIGELEQILVSIGVERFVLPAVPQLLETWTSSFGFSKMSSTERLNILDYSVLNFQDTTMCQKILRVPAAAQPKPKDDSNSNIAFDIRRLADHELILALPCFRANSSHAAAATGTCEPASRQSFHAHNIDSSSFVNPAQQTMWNELKQAV